MSKLGERLRRIAEETQLRDAATTQRAMILKDASRGIDKSAMICTRWIADCLADLYDEFQEMAQENPAIALNRTSNIGIPHFRWESILQKPTSFGETGEIITVLSAFVHTNGRHVQLFLVSDVTNFMVASRLPQTAPIPENDFPEVVPAIFVPVLAQIPTTARNLSRRVLLIDTKLLDPQAYAASNWPKVAECAFRTLYKTRQFSLTPSIANSRIAGFSMSYQLLKEEARTDEFYPFGEESNLTLVNSWTKMETPYALFFS